MPADEQNEQSRMTDTLITLVLEADEFPSPEQAREILRENDIDLSDLESRVKQKLSGLSGTGATLLQQRLVRRFGLHYVAHIAGRSSIGTTEEAAIEGLVECLHPYWIAYCPECDWLDSSENAAGGKPTGDDYTDAICPKCCADPNDPECVGKNVVIEEFSLPNTEGQATAKPLPAPVCSSSSELPTNTDTMKGKYENTNPLEKLHAGEPYFFLRAQDMHSTYAVRQYAEAVGVLDPKGKAECLAFADRMEKWQDENADKVKQPD